MQANERDALAELASWQDRRWEALTEGTRAAAREREAILVFGSLARNEFTSGSDVDWALLIDGPADPQHFEIAQKLVPFFSDKPPGPTQVFGGPIFSSSRRITI